MSLPSATQAALNESKALGRCGAAFLGSEFVLTFSSAWVNLLAMIVQMVNTNHRIALWAFANGRLFLLRRLRQRGTNGGFTAVLRFRQLDLPCLESFVLVLSRNVPDQVFQALNVFGGEPEHCGLLRRRERVADCHEDSLQRR